MNTINHLYDITNYVKDVLIDCKNILVSHTHKYNNIIHNKHNHNDNKNEDKENEPFIPLSSIVIENDPLTSIYSIENKDCVNINYIIDINSV